MTLRSLRFLGIVCFLLCSGFAVWGWFRPYEWGADERAGCRIVQTRITRDHSYFWIDVHLRMDADVGSSQVLPVQLESASGARHQPADIIFAKGDPQNAGEIWVKFWLESADLQGVLRLRLNEGQLVVKATQPVPEMDSSASQNYTSNHW